ncbi:AMIN-like domain-containing (lipo)protein [Sphaerisporangium rhizosphaerae]|uniref:AMIN-like domain-containing protein n=1 Tax=Sphaerisporangium rhizosphaerae TaxID=2269375 RepID=A0ABW2NZF7_9ACTN
MNRIAVAAALLPVALATAACGAAPGSDTSASSTPAASSPGPAPASPDPSISSPAVTPAVTPVVTPSGRTVPTPGETGGVPPVSRTPTAGASEPPAPTSTRRVAVTRSPERPPVVTGARFAAHPGFDRVVIDLRGAKTGYSVDWVRKLYEDGSGKLVDIKGGAYLQVMLKPANAHTENGRPTFPRTPVLRPGLPNLLGVVRTGDYEGVVTVALVLRERAGFRVFEQSDPARLVIDVAH